MFLSVLFVFVLFEQYIPVYQQGIISVALVLTLINCGAIMEQKKWVVYLEFLRLLTVSIGIVIIHSTGWYLLLLLPAVAVLCTWHFDAIRNWYLRLVYNSY